MPNTTGRPTKFEGDARDVENITANNPLLGELEIQLAFEPLMERLAALPPPAFKAVAGDGGLEGFVAAARASIMETSRRDSLIIDKACADPPVPVIQAVARIYGQVMKDCYSELVAKIKGMDTEARKAFVKESESFPKGGILLDKTVKSVDAIFERANQYLASQEQGMDSNGENDSNTEFVFH